MNKAFLPKCLRHTRRRIQVCSQVFFALASLFLSSSLQYVYAQNVVDTDKPRQPSPVLQAVIDAARESANGTYKENDHGLNKTLKAIDYQTYRAIRFKPEKSLWRDKNDYEIQFFHPGFLYNTPITVHTISEDNQPERLNFNSDMFSYEGSAASLAGLTDNNTGYAGFRVHYPIKNNQYKDEFAVFLGASYFRLVGKHQVYGISARGLAIDTALPKGEEFPHFTEFWIVEPKENQPITVYARLESPSVAGAYRFVIHPGVDTTVDVQSWLFAREDVQKLGVAPFTSMFLYGENSKKHHDDYRPEVHDSDGVLMVTHAGEEIWRPLTNPNRLQITSLSDSAPKGFGMFQRDGRWENYLDAEASYHLRPSLWVSPKAGFEQGRLEVVEIPTSSEVHDNVVAYWIPDAPLLAGESRYFAYQLSTAEQYAFDSNLATVLRTRQGKAVLPGDEFEDESLATTRQFSVDFSVPSEFDVNPDDLTFVVQGINAEVSKIRVYAVDEGSEWRGTFMVKPNEGSTVDMRAFIEAKGKRVSEVWNYVYQSE
ncbi:glucan biosynthesis protein [Alteromonas sp. A079]|uniref:glucan biosynthesis protein n=1 Tax=Alteromonas sp. A079 TaxID=3410268 RepID=UPI003BA255A2